MTTESFNLFLYLFLSEVESRQENVRKNLRTKFNRSKIKQKINTELALYPLLHVLTEKKDTTGLVVPISILLVKPFAFGK